MIATSDLRPTDDEIKAALPAFTGDIMQVPPQFSAVKIDGERAYKLAREGEEMDLAARPLFVDELSLVARPDADHVTLEMVCGKGGYVRSIARDLGEILGCHAHVTASAPRLVRPVRGQGRHHPRPDRKTRANRPNSTRYLRPLEEGLADLPELRCTPEGAARLRNGNPGMVI